MEIKKLIEAFELAIPTYQKCVDEKWNINKLVNEHLHWGLCYYFEIKLNISIRNLFGDYYQHYITYYGYLFEDPQPQYSTIENINKCIKPRLEFMKSEVKDLKRLLKQGYTHV